MTAGRGAGFEDATVIDTDIDDDPRTRRRWWQLLMGIAIDGALTLEQRHDDAGTDGTVV